MSLSLVHDLVDSYRQLFHLTDTIDLIELEQQLAGPLDEILNNEDDFDEDALTETLRKTVLRKISETPKLYLLAEKSFAEFQEVAHTGSREFTYPQSEDPLDDEHVELMFESIAIWSVLPHTLVTKNWDLIKKAAIKYHEPSRIDPELEFDDLLSVGGEALITAAEKMFEKPRPDFRKFAMQTLKDRIRSHQNNKHPVPYKTRKKLEKLKELRDHNRTHGVTLQKEDYSGQMGVSQEEMQGLLEVETIWGTGHMVDIGDRMEELEVPDLSPDALSLLIDQETSMRMSEAMTNLSGTQRNVILQIYFRDKSFRQTAEVLNLSLSVVKKHHRNAMDKLKKRID